MGEWIGMAPVGYLNARDERGRSTVIPDPDRAPHIRKLFEEYSTGCYTLSELRKRSMELGLKNLRGPKKTWLTKSQLHLMIKNPFYYGVMEVKGQRYPHVYEPIITKEIYDLCQQVRLGWHKKPFLYASKEFVFRGLLTCATTGRVCTSETKTKTYPNGSTGSWTYVRCWKPDAPKKLMWVREEKLLGQIEEVFQSMRLDPALMDDVTEYARRACEAEQEFHRGQVKALHREYDGLQTKLDRLMDLLLEGSISKEQHDAKRAQIKTDQQVVTRRLESYTSADDGFREAVVDVLSLAADAHLLFKCSKPQQQRRLINFVF